MRTVAIIPAGGKGKRVGGNTPKQYIKIFGKELIVYTLEIFQKSRFVDEIVIAAEPVYFKKLQALKLKYKLSKITNIIPGGEERQDSVFNALSSLSVKKNDLIIVHDAARPFLDKKTLEEAIAVAGKKGNSIVCIKAKDTLVKQEGNELNYVDRRNIFCIQTPQTAKYSQMMAAFTKAKEEGFKGTDESMLLQNAGFNISFTEGSILNFKVTTADDVAVAKLLFKNKK